MYAREPGPGPARTTPRDFSLIITARVIRAHTVVVVVAPVHNYTQYSIVSCCGRAATGDKKK